MGFQELASRGPRSSYRAPERTTQTTLSRTLADIGRPPLEGTQTSWIADGQSQSDTHIFYSGDLSILRTSVAVVGARAVSPEGAARARRLSKELAEAGVTIVSGLAKGVDLNAHRAALGAGGRTAAVVGTPIGQAYPAEHAELQALIGREQLLISPFPEGQRVYPSNFPKRNRVMAALTLGTVIVEASDSSGTLHQAVECEKLGRWLFILKSVVDDASLTWPKRYLRYDKVQVVTNAEDVLGALSV
jgi:DNA processing protein